MKTVAFICPVCGKDAEKPAHLYRWAMKKGLNVFCSRKCSGISRRTDPLDESPDYFQKIKKQRWADWAGKNADRILAKRRDRYKKNPEKYRAQRRAWFEDNREFMKIYTRKRWDKFKDQINAHRRLRRKIDPEYKARVAEQVRLSRHRAKFDPVRKLLLLERQRRWRKRYPEKVLEIAKRGHFKKNYGEFAEALRVLRQLEVEIAKNEIAKEMIKYEKNRNRRIAVG